MTRSQIRFLAVVALILFFVFGASLVRSEAWSAFEARCLAPMEDFHAPVTEGLDGSDSHADPDGAFSMMVSDGTGCTVISGAAGDDDWSKAMDWREAALASKRYEPTEDKSLFLTTTWREPRLSVFLHYDAKRRHAVFTAKDTDLES